MITNIKGPNRRNQRIFIINSKCDFISTYNSRTNTTINTSSYTVANPYTDSRTETFYTILQLTTFVQWKGLDSLPKPLGRSCDSNPMPTCAPPVWDGRTEAHIMS